MKTITKFAAVLLFVATPAFAGKGGSNAKIAAAVQSGSTDAIIAEVERAEALMCNDCIQTVTNLTEDSRFAVREVAAWWFARRPPLREMMVDQMIDDLTSADALHVRNAADFVGRVRSFRSLPALRTAFARGLTPEARLAIVNAVGFMAHASGNSILTAAMSDSDAGVRAAAVIAWRDILGQKTAQPVEALLADSDARVRAEAATVIGAYADATVRTQLEKLVTSDPDAQVRRNAAWALGKIGSADSRAALTLASGDSSGLVRGVAKASLAQLH